MHSEAPTGAFDWAIEFAEIFAPRPALGALDGGLNLGDTLAATEAGGFDIILANPPYVRQELIKAQKPILKSRYECFDGYADLFVYFYERAVKILRDGGTLAFISSNKYYRAGYGAKLREFLATKTSVQTMIDFGDAPVLRGNCVRLYPNRHPYQTGGRHGGAYPDVDTRGSVRPTRRNIRRRQPDPPTERTEPRWLAVRIPLVLRLLAKFRSRGKPLGEYVNGRF